MNQNEVRHQVISVLLQVGGPLTRSALAVQCRIAETDIRAVIGEVVHDGLVIEGRLLRGEPPTAMPCASGWPTAEST